MTRALDVALPLLVCPHCRETLTRLDQRSVGCTRRHRFDLARQGYLPLLGGRSRTDTGDDAAMVAARAEFLDRGHYLPIAEAVAQRCAGAVLEIGAGTGYYLAHTDPDIGIAVDSSRYAARRAARAHHRVASVLADAWAPLPIADAVVDTVLVIFAPRVPEEIARVLRPRRSRFGGDAPAGASCGGAPAAGDAGDRRRQGGGTAWPLVVRLQRGGCGAGDRRAATGTR